MTTLTSFTFGTSLDATVADARPQVEAALQAEGFGIITEIDLQATYKAKLGIDTDPYLILGACNPGLSYRAIQAEPAIGALLPCNVVLRPDPTNKARTIVEAMDPVAVLGLVDSVDVAPVARQVREKLERAVASLG